MELDDHVTFLTDFAHSYFTGDETRNALIRLKLDHTLRVLANAKSITESESLDAQTTRLGLLASLYHDIGRFPQLANYGTFNDRESVNHGRLGVLALRDLNIPGELTNEDLRMIRFTVGQHNVRTTRDSLPKQLSAMVNLVRDADKLDIFKVMIDHFSGDNPDPTITHGHPDIPNKYSDSIYDTVLNRRTGDYNDITCANDFKILVVGWVHDFNFRTSLTLLTKRNLIQKMFSFLPKDKRIQTLENRMNEITHYNSYSAS